MAAKRFFWIPIILIIPGLFLIVSCVRQPTDPWPDHDTDIGFISRIIGSGAVELNKRPAFEGDRFHSGDHITTAEAKAEVSLRNGGKIIFDEKTDPSIFLDWIRSGICELSLLIDVGRVFVDSDCKIKAKTGSNAVVESLGTVLHLYVSENETHLTVIKGTARIRSNVGPFEVVEAGYQSIARRGRRADRAKRVNIRRVIHWVRPFRTPEPWGDHGRRDRKMVTVPSFVGQKFENAEKSIYSQRLEVGRIRYEPTSDRKKNGLVAAQTPKRGTRVAPHFPVDLTVFRYERRIPQRQIQVPDLIKLTLDQGEKRVENAGLRIGHVNFRPTDHRRIDGRIVNQTPSPGTLVPPGTVMTLTVFRFQPGDSHERILVPKLAGLNLRIAEKKIFDAGFALGKVRYIRTKNRDFHSTVIRQSPTAGARASRDARIDLWVYRLDTGSRNQRQVIVPDLVGKNLGEAKEILKKHNLTVGELVVKKPRRRKDAGIIYHQKPSAGMRVPSETPVYLWVYQSRFYRIRPLNP